MTRIFLSHSSKNSPLANTVASFLESASSEIRVFCSSATGTIPIGTNFEREIKRELDRSDVFLPLLSEDYYKSRYCMMELGFAYSYLSSRFEAAEDEYILPLIVPPIKRDEALSGTPLVFLQAGSVFQESDIHILLSVLKRKKGIDLKAGINDRISQFIIEAKTIIFKSFNFLSTSTTLTCKSGNVHGADRDYITHSHYSDETSDGYSVNFNLRPYENSVAEPDFISFVIKFPVKADLYQIVNIYEDAMLSFDIVNFTDSVREMDIEVKFTDHLQILKKQNIALASGKATYSLKLKDMRSEALKEIAEICFVLVPSYIAPAEREGMFQVLNTRIITG